MTYQDRIEHMRYENRIYDKFLWDNLGKNDPNIRRIKKQTYELMMMNCNRINHLKQSADYFANR